MGVKTGPQKWMKCPRMNRELRKLDTAMWMFPGYL